jgi:hypothetical protein
MIRQFYDVAIAPNRAIHLLSADTVGLDEWDQPTIMRGAALCGFMGVFWMRVLRPATGQRRCKSCEKYRISWEAANVH